MSKEYFPFEVGDKVVTTSEYSGFFDKKGEVNKEYPYVEITAIGNTMFLATDKANEHLYCKLKQWELYDPNRIIKRKKK